VKYNRFMPLSIPMLLMFGFAIAGHGPLSGAFAVVFSAGVVVVCVDHIANEFHSAIRQSTPTGKEQTG
jgi:hypothetical protein